MEKQRDPKVMVLVPQSEAVRLGWFSSIDKSKTGVFCWMLQTTVGKVKVQRIFVSH